MKPPPTLITSFQRIFPGAAPPFIANGAGGPVWVAAAPNGSAVMTLAMPALDAHIAFRLSAPGQPANRADVLGMPLPPWALYIGAVGWGWAAHGHAVPGLDAVIHPEGGIREGLVWQTGLAFAAVWQDIGGWPLPEGGLLGLMTRLGGFFH